ASSRRGPQCPAGPGRRTVLFEPDDVERLVGQSMVPTRGWSKVLLPVDSVRTLCCRHISGLVAHNASFDIGAIRAASAASGLSWRSLQYGCTLQWARRDLPGLSNYKLPTVSAALDVDLRQHHDASADASAAASVALELMRRNRARSVDSYAANLGMRLGHATVESKTAPGDLGSRKRQEGR